MRGQGSLEYLLILAAILAIAVVVVLIANTMLGSPKEANTVNQDKYSLAVAGWEVRNYDRTFDPDNTDTAPDSIVKGGQTFIFGGKVGELPAGQSIIGVIHDEEGNGYGVSAPSGGGGTQYYYIIDPNAPPLPPPGPTPFIAAFIAVGDSHTCASTGSAVYCWGDNTYGKLGTGDTTERHTPALTSIAETMPSAGGRHTCAKGPTVAYCWGANDFGQLGLGDNSNRNTPAPLPAFALSGGVKTTTGGIHTCATNTTGTYCWGYNYYGQLGNGSIGPVSGAGATTPAIIPGFGTASSISAGGYHTCATNSSGTWCWGMNDEGQVGDGTSGINRYKPTLITGFGTASSISAGGHHTCAIKGDSTLWCWGNNTYGQLGTGGTNPYVNTPTQLSTFGTAKAVSAGAYSTCAIKGDNTLWCWGKNTNGQLGLGDYAERHSPIQVLSMGTVSQVAAGSYHTCAINATGTYCWGLNDKGQLGNGTTDSGNSPVMVVASP